MGSLSRRDFFSLGLGAGCFAVVSGLGLLRPRKAYAVAGIDDLALGGLVLLVATLGGYAFSRSVANVSLDTLGYGFSDFVSDANNQAAAVTQAIADANNLGVELNRSNAENAAQSIAAGTGYFAEVMGDAATSGRVALDNFISGAGELPGVLRTLVGNFIDSKVKSDDGFARLNGPANLNTDWITSDSGTQLNSTLTSKMQTAGVNDVWDAVSNEASAGAWAIRCTLGSAGIGRVSGYYYYTGGSDVKFKLGTNSVLSASEGTITEVFVNTRANTTTVSTYTYFGFNLLSNSNYGWVLSGNLLSSGALPAVDRAVDAPDVIGPGYDTLPLANDLVIDPSTDEVVSAGSLPLPTTIPDVFGDYVGTLNDILAGVIPGQISLPISVAEPVVVGTAEGVQSMSITDAIAGDTSLSAAISPPVGPYPPYDPVEPPVDVPEGPWTPAVSLPFEQIWPFNMIFSFVELFEQLGGS